MALPAQLDAVLTESLEAERRKVDGDLRAAESINDFAARAAAMAGVRLYGLHVAKAERVRAAGDVELASQLVTQVREEARLPSVLAPEAERRTVLGAVAEVGGGMARDAAEVAATTGRGWLAVLKASPYVVLGVVVVVVLMWARRLAPPPRS